MDEEINLRRYLEIFWKRKFIIIVLMVAGGIVMVWPALSLKPMYEAKAKFMLKGDQQPSVTNNVDLATMLKSSGSSFSTLIQSRAVAELVLDNLALRKRIEGWDDPDVDKNDLISAVQHMPKFRGADEFEIEVVSNDPQLSADPANGFAEAGKEYWRKMNYTEARKKREYIESQLPRIESDLRKAENRLKGFSLLGGNPFSASSIELVRLRRM